MAVTVKKKKVTVKTIKAKASSSKKSSAVKTKADTPSAFSSSIKQPASGASNAKAQSYIIDSIIALLAIIIFVVLLSIQTMEISYYKTPPGVWPNISLITQPQSSRPQPDQDEDEEQIEESSELEE